MDLTGLKKKDTPKKDASPEAVEPADSDAKPVGEGKAAKKAPAKPAGADPAPVRPPKVANLHKPVRGKKVPRQFMLSQESSLEFDIAASEAGYNKRQGSDFFEHVWEFYKDNQ